MKIKENIRLFAVIGCVFILIYTLIAVHPLGRELQLTPVWSISVTDRNIYTGTDSSGQDTLLPFELGQNMGYFTTNGKIALLETFPFKATISGTYRASFGQDASSIPFYTSPAVDPAQENPAGTIDGTGFPFFQDDRIYLFPPGGYGLAQCNTDGSIKWQFDYYVPLICFSSSPAGTAAGFADGSVIVFSPEGSVTQTFVPGGSEYSIILGTALSDSGTQLACVSGINDQRFVLTQEKNGLNKIVFHTYLDNNLREPTLVHFSADEQYVFYGFSGGLGMVDCSSLQHKQLPVTGRILAVEEYADKNIFCTLTKSEDTYSVYFIEGFGNMIGSFSFEADNAFITVHDNALYVGKNNTISRMDINWK